MQDSRPYVNLIPKSVVYPNQCILSSKIPPGKECNMLESVDKLRIVRNQWSEE